MSKVTLDIDNVGIELNPESQSTIYNIHGIKVDGNNLPTGIYLKRSGTKTEKIIKK